MSEHTASDDHGHNHGHGAEPHSHQKTFIILAVVLGVITVAELGVLFDFIKEIFTTDMLNIGLVVMSMVKLAFVVGIYMHLKYDFEEVIEVEHRRTKTGRVYTLLFVAPMIVAMLAIIILQAMSGGHYKTFVGDLETIRECDDANTCPKILKEEELQEEYKKAQANKFKVGAEIYTANCSSCHRADGGGGVGPAMTDDCYKNGGSLESIVKAIDLGVNGTAMPAWRYEFRDDEKVRQVAYYIRSLQGKSVPNPKACEGEKYQASAAP